MIDTIRFKIPIDSFTFDEMKNRKRGIKVGKEKVEQAILSYQHKRTSRGVTIKKLYGEFIVPDYHCPIRVEVERKDLGCAIYLEFSVPKFVYGHNISLYYSEESEKVLFDIQVGLEERFNIKVVSFEEWIVQRVDYCYVWKFKNQQTANDVLMSMRSFEYPRKEEAIYKTGIVFRGNSFSINFYLKKDDFQKKEYLTIAKHDQKRADELLEFSEGCLRFEVQYRKSKLTSLYKNKELHVHDVNDKYHIEKILRKELRILTKKMNPKVVSVSEVADALIGFYGVKKGIPLFTFYLAYLDPITKKVLKNRIDKSTCNRKLADIAEANVGIITKVKNLKAELTIPSPLVPNKENVEAAEAAPQAAGSGNEAVQEPLISGS